MLAYVNGEFVDDRTATVSVRDRGFLLGDGVFDAWRTYGGGVVPSVVERNLERFRRSINYLELPGAALAEEIGTAAAELIERNADEISAVGDIWIHAYVTRGAAYELEADAAQATRIAICTPIPFRSMFAGGELYDRGAHLVSSLMTVNPFWPVDPRVKSISRLAYVRAERKQARVGAGTWSLLFDNEGYVVEAAAAGLCVVEGETIVKPPRWKALESITMQVFCELGRQLGYGVEERPLTTYDLLNADEVYVSATSFGAVHVSDLDGVPLTCAGRVGPRILDAWIEYVGFDFRAQARELGRAAGVAARA
jgi:branched-subunit amino acid aminotransferase/4-amino-4-deoxychorismate lyase